MAIVTKDERVHLVATGTQVAAWKLHAEAAGVSLSEWLRRAAQTRIAVEGRTSEPSPRRSS